MNTILRSIIFSIALFACASNIAAQQKLKVGNRTTKFAANTVFEVEGSVDSVKSRFVMTNAGTVGIGTATPVASAILDLTAADKALLLPRVQLLGTNDTTTVLSPVSGMLVSNIADAGGVTNAVFANTIYRFNGVVWDFLVDGNELNKTINGFSVSILGYTPVRAALRTVPATAPGGATVTEIGCKTNPADNHVFCAYQLSAGTNFYNTFQLARNIGGYLPTMTTTAERTWVHTNIVGPGPAGYNLQRSIWIGFSKVNYPGNPLIFLWITGEDFFVDWTTSPFSTPNNYFGAGEPNNLGGTEGCGHIKSSCLIAGRTWNDLQGTAVVDGGVCTTFDQVIVEFNAP